MMMMEEVDDVVSVVGYYFFLDFWKNILNMFLMKCLCKSILCCSKTLGKLKKTDDDTVDDNDDDDDILMDIFQKLSFHRKSFNIHIKHL